MKLTDPLSQNTEIVRNKMVVLSKLQNEGLNKVVEEIKKQPKPQEARVIRMTKNEVSVFENTEKAALFFREMVQELMGWTVTLESMIGVLNNDERLSENKKKYILNDVLDIEIII